MDPKRKRIYIIIILVCVSAAVGVVLFGRLGGGGGPSVAPGILSTPTNQSSAADVVTGDAKSGFTAPAVFPINPNFDFSVLDSSSFKQLIPFTPVVSQPGELGRDDPFKNY